MKEKGRGVLPAVFLLLLFVFGDEAFPLVIFNGGGPDATLTTASVGGQMITRLFADDFQLAAPYTVTDAHFWTLEFTNGWDGTLKYYIYNDSSGPSTAIVSGVAGTNVVKSATGRSINLPTPAGLLAASEYLYSFDLAAPLSLLGGTTYWFGLQLDANYLLNNPPYAFPSVFWESTSAGFGSNTRYLTGGSGAWNVVTGPSTKPDQDLAFRLTGSLPVPEPSTFLLLGGGLVGIGILRKRIKK